MNYFTGYSTANVKAETDVVAIRIPKLIVKTILPILKNLERMMKRR